MSESIFVAIVKFTVWCVLASLKDIISFYEVYYMIAFDVLVIIRKYNHILHEIKSFNTI